MKDLLTFINPTQTVTRTAGDFAISEGPDAAAEGLIESLIDEVRADRGRLSVDDLADLSKLQDALSTHVAFAPALAKAVARVIGISREKLDGGESIAAAMRQAGEAVTTQIRSHRAEIATIASQVISADEGHTIYVHGAGERTIACLERVVLAAHGQLSILVSTDERDPSSQSAGALAHTIRTRLAADRGGPRADVSAVRLADAPRSLFTSDYAILSVTSVLPGGDIVAPHGSEIVCQAATSYGPGLVVLFDEDDVCPRSSVDAVYEDPRCALLRGGPAIHYVTTRGLFDLDDLHRPLFEPA